MVAKTPEKKTGKELIFDALNSSDTPLSAAELTRLCNISSRNYTSLLLSQLVQSGEIISERSGRNITYSPSKILTFIDTDLALTNLSEDTIWQQIRELPRFIKAVPERTENILYFAFTEMLNNAIDHSKSGIGHIKVWQENDTIKFIVNDKGIGAFRNFMTKKHLDSESVAIQELIKGKSTTMPRRHSGEGIFWTSKIADRFNIYSYDYALLLDNLFDDYAIKKLDDSVLGTEVHFEIHQHTDKSLQQLFSNYSLNHKTYSFDTTSIPVKLFDEGDVWISRSQAKRILHDLEKYQKIILNFAGIDTIGQGFADEIFRVFQNSHPNIVIEAINTSKSVALMIDHVAKG